MIRDVQMFTSTHFAGLDLDTKYRNGEPWKKVFGPNFIYLNSVPSNDEYIPFWHDAKQQVLLIILFIASISII